MTAPTDLQARLAEIARAECLLDYPDRDPEELFMSGVSEDQFETSLLALRLPQIERIVNAFLSPIDSPSSPVSQQDDRLDISGKPSKEWRCHKCGELTGLGPYRMSVDCRRVSHLGECPAPQGEEGI